MHYKHIIIYISKALWYNLTGEDRNSTIIDGGGLGDVVHVSGDWVNVSGFMIKNSGNTGPPQNDAGVEFNNVQNGYIGHNNVFNNSLGIFLDSSSENIISSNTLTINEVAIWLYSSYENIISRNNASSNNLHGIFISGSGSNNISSNTVFNNDFGISILVSSKGSNIISNNVTHNGYGIYLTYSHENNIICNNVINNSEGIFCGSSSRNNILGNIASANLQGICLQSSSKNNILGNNASDNIYGICLESSSEDNITDNTVLNNRYGIYLMDSSVNNLIINCSLLSTNYDFIFEQDSHMTAINTTFDKSKVYFDDLNSKFTVRWYMHVYVKSTGEVPISDAKVNITNVTCNPIEGSPFTTGNDGFIKWIVVTEYFEQDIDGDTIGEKIYHNPYKITAWNDTLVGYAKTFINESKTITIVLYNGTFLNLESGWNLVSLPRIQSDSNPLVILQSIEGQYDAVQRYNATDQNDPWKHLRISKPSSFNDLNELDPYMGFWIHITDPGGTALAVFGEEFTTDQIIPLYKGWNHVGYPSSITRTPDFGLPPSVDMIQWYNGSSGLWESWDPGSYSSDNLISIKAGNGLWIHCTQAYDEWILEHYIPPQVDWIEIVDTPLTGVSLIPNFPIDVNQTVWGYAAAYNISAGYLGDIIVTWSVQNIGGANASTNPILSDGSGFYSGDSAGMATWTADDGNGHTDSITVTINSP